MVVYVVVTSFLRNVAFLIYALFGEISILEIPVVGNFSLFAGLLEPTFAWCEIDIRGNGEWTKGQHSWNISITKEARMDPEVVLDSSAECLFRGIFFCP